MTLASGSPLSSGAYSSLRCRAPGGGPQLQPTGRTRQKRAEGMAGVTEEKPTKGEAHPFPPPSLWSSNSLIRNLRLTPSLCLSSDSHHSNTHIHSSWSYHWLPSSHPQAMNGQTGNKTQQQPTQEVQLLALGSERHILSRPLSLRSQCERSFTLLSHECGYGFFQSSLMILFNFTKRFVCTRTVGLYILLLLDECCMCFIIS